MKLNIAIRTVKVTCVHHVTPLQLLLLLVHGHHSRDHRLKVGHFKAKYEDDG